MRGLALAWICCAACFDPNLPAVQCGAQGQCPDGTTCDVDNVCREQPLGAADSAPPSDSDPNAPDADPQTVLVDRGLIGRYFLDEAASGTAPSVAIDSAASPLDLPIIYGASGGNATFTEVAGNRGLRFSTEGGAGGAGAAIAGTKLQSRFDGNTRATLEAVVDIQAVTSLSSRIIHWGTDAEAGRLTLSSPNLTALEFFWQGNTEGAHFTTPVDRGRMVLHFVLDTNELVPEDRTRLYIDGVRQTMSAGNTPSLGQAIDLTDTDAMVLGNRAVGSRSFTGVFFYGAVYNEAFTDAEVAQNAAILIADDDS